MDGRDVLPLADRLAGYAKQATDRLRAANAPDDLRCDFCVWVAHVAHGKRGFCDVQAIFLRYDIINSLPTVQVALTL